MRDELAQLDRGPVGRIVSSLVFHQCSLPIERASSRLYAKRFGLTALFVADYGEQRAASCASRSGRFSVLTAMRTPSRTRTGCFPSSSPKPGFSISRSAR